MRFAEVISHILQRSYNVSLTHNKIPDALCQLAKKMASPAMPSGEEFQPEAAIVNYFGLGTLHLLVELFLTCQQTPNYCELRQRLG